LFHVDGQTDMTKLIVAFRNFANAPKNWIEIISVIFSRLITTEVCLRHRDSFSAEWYEWNQVHSRAFTCTFPLRILHAVPPFNHWHAEGTSPLLTAKQNPYRQIYIL
jgi:hypothetical protein